MIGIEEVKNDIETLVNKAIALADAADAVKETASIREIEALEKRALGYFAAARALLNAYADLHNEMIDIPQFVRLRRLQRQY